MQVIRSYIDVSTLIQLSDVLWNWWYEHNKIIKTEQAWQDYVWLTCDTNSGSGSTGDKRAVLVVNSSDVPSSPNSANNGGSEPSDNDCSKLSFWPCLPNHGSRVSYAFAFRGGEMSSNQKIPQVIMKNVMMAE